MITIEEAVGSLVIDTTKLDEECRFQPIIFYEVAKQAVLKSSERDFLKEKKDKIWANSFISEKMEGKLDGKSLSDKTAETFADVSEKVEISTKEYLEKKKEADEWIALKDSFQQRAIMLKELCGLQVSGAYGEIVVQNKTVDDSKVARIKREMRKQ